MTHSGAFHTGAIMREIHENAKRQREAAKEYKETVKAQTKAACKELKDENSALRQGVRTNWNAFHAQFGKVKEFLKTNLTSEEKTAITGIWTTHVTARQAIVSGTGTDLEKIEALKASLQTALTAIKPYVATDKLSAYETFVTERIALLTKNATARAEIAANRAECKTVRTDAKTAIKNRVTEIKDEFVTQFVSTVRAQIGNVPAEKQARVYAELVKRIDSLLTKSVSEASKTSFTALRAEIQAKIDALNATAN